MRFRRGSLVAALAIGIVAGGSLASVTTAQDESVTLTLLHNNDGESSLLPLTNAVGEDTTLSVGGIPAFKSVTLRELAAARELGHSVLNVYAGDSFLASATLACSAPEEPGISSLPADAIAQAQIPYDVHVFGNHEFDYGPDFLQRFIFGFVGETGRRAAVPVGQPRLLGRARLERLDRRRRHRRDARDRQPGRRPLGDRDRRRDRRALRRRRRDDPAAARHLLAPRRRRGSRHGGDRGRRPGGDRRARRAWAWTGSSS